MSGPLEGLRVLDISTIIAAPFSGTLMSDYGAEVVKAELPGVGDGLRGFPPQRDGKSLWWKNANRNKRFISLDLRKPEGKDLLLKMLPKFDVLLENFRPGTLDKWGLDKDTLWAACPRLVILRATGFGQTGPYRNRRGFAKVFEAMSGLTYITGDPEDVPMGAGYPIGDAIGGLFACTSVLAALLGMARGTIREGEEIDLSLTEATFRVLDSQTIGYDQIGEIAKRNGNQSYYSAPANVFKTGDDQYVSLSGSTEAIFRANARAIGLPNLGDDPRFVTNVKRIEHRADIDAIFTGWFTAHTADEAIEAFTREGGTLTRIYSIDRIYEDPQFIAREAITTIPDEDFGEVRVQNVVPKFSRNPGKVRHTAKDLGADNAEVFGEYLDLGADELAALADKGVI
ncbi:MAG: CoA transferase [Chromatiales bacterium]|jgi:crotonobetainyl-CoA:carnitine CoA-transferase CaiB-like acyl-CoA transferase|nr:CoA transferase [Chromatiales bacterium]